MIYSRVGAWLTLVSAGLLLSACAGASANPAASGSPAASTPAPPSATPTTPPRPTISRVISAGGVRQYLKCGGNGPVTVVIVPGLGTGTSAWSQVYPEIRKQTRTCIYDRPGIGRSPARTGSTSLEAGQHARELWALLKKAGEVAPFVPVGHSYGGLVARAFIHQHRSDIAGVMLAESVTPGDPYNGTTWPEGGTTIDLGASSDATGDGPRIGSTPLVVLSASNPEGDHLGGPTYGFGQEVIDGWIAGQRDDLRLSSDSIRVIAHSGHVLQQDNAPATIRSIEVLLAAIETGRPLTCGHGWKAVGATCVGG